MRQFMTSLVGLITITAATAAPPQIVIFTDEAGNTTVQSRAISAGEISQSGWTTASESAAREAFALRSPDRSTVAVGLLDASGNLTVRAFTDSGFGAFVTVATGVPATRPAPLAAGYMSRSGRLVIAYTLAGSNECLVRTYDGSVSNASSAPLGLSSAPVRLVVAPSPGSDDVLIVAQDGSQRLGAAIWNGSEFRATELLDNGFDGGPNRWDAVWSRSGGPMVAWARSSDTTLRVRQYGGDAWDLMDSTPVAPGAIGRVMLTADGARGGVGVAAAVVSGTGRLDVSTLDGGAWSMPTLMTTSLDAGKDQPVGLMYEGTGGRLVCAWLESGSERVHLRRRGDSVWGVTSTSQAMGSGLMQLCIGPDEDDAGVVIVARQVIGDGGDQAVANGYWLNTELAPFGAAESTVAQMKYRMSGSNWDQSLDNGSGTSPGRFIHAGLGNNQQLSQRVYEFRVQHIAGAGFIFRMTNITDPQNPGNPSILSWGTFSNPTGGTSVAQLNGVSPGASFNGLRIEARSTRANSSMTWSDLSFDGTGMSLQAGLWRTGSVTPSTSGPGDSAGFHYQQLNATGDLSQVNWTLTGRVRGVRTGAQGGDETVRFVVSARQYAALSPTTQRIYALVVSAGNPGAVTELSTAAIEGDTPPPLAVSAPPIQSSTRVVRWREVAPE